MASILPLIPALRSFAHPVRPTLADRPITPERDLRGHKEQITSALLGDAMLAVTDLPEGWVPDGADDARSLLAGSEYQALFIADLSVRLRRPATGEALEQHIGVLPRWAVRHLADELDCAVTEQLTHERRSTRTVVLEVPPAADQRFGMRVAQRTTAGIAPSTDAVLMRRGGLIMALAYWREDGRPTDPEMTAALALLADARWAGTANALR